MTQGRRFRATSRLRLVGQAVPGVAAVAAAVYATAGLRPPRPQGAKALSEDFSAARAEPHLQAIAVAPHPTGSPAAAVVRGYLVEQLRALGLETSVQDAFAANELGMTPYGVPYRAAGRARNVIARLPGKEQGSALLLMTHYDSVAQGPGASDAGMLAAALLEMLRALRAGPPLRNDVLVLITDAEEAGLLGATAFFTEHPLAGQVRAVLNFEARGTSGTALMFEAGPGNGPVVRELAASGVPAFASSLFDEVYRHLPNATDFTLAKQRRLPGLNFANIGGFVNYHGPRDDLARADRGTLQHHGELMLALARRLGGADLDQLRTGQDEVFFTLGAGKLVRYPKAAAVPLALAATGVAALALRARTPGAQTAGRVALSVAARTVAGAAITSALAAGLGKISPEFRRHGDFYDSDRLYAAVVGISCAFSLAAGPRPADPLNRVRACLPPLALGSLALAARLPGGSYLTTWPLAGGSLALLTGRAPTPIRQLGAAASALPAVALLAPLSRQLFQGLTPRMSASAALALQICAELSAPALAGLPTPVRRGLALSGAATAATVAAHHVVNRSPSAQRPVPDTISYLLDADRGRALWLSTDPRPSSWTARFLGTRPERGRLPEYFPGWQRDFLHTPATLLDLPAPELEVLSETVTEDGRRRVELRLRSPRGARLLCLTTADAPVYAWAVEGRWAAPAPGVAAEALPWELWLYGAPPEGITVAVEVDASPIRLRVADRSDGVPPELTPTADHQALASRVAAAALDVETWGNATLVVRWTKV